MLDKSKLKSAGSLGSKKGPANGFCDWLGSPESAVLGVGCWPTVEDRLALRPLVLVFRLNVGDTGDWVVNGLWLIVVSG
jgi:hypothetical protein